MSDELKTASKSVVPIVVSLVFAGLSVIWLKHVDALDAFLENLRDFDIGGVLVLFSSAMVITYRTETGRTAFSWMLLATLVFVFSHLILSGLPDLDGRANLRGLYAVFGGLFYTGFVVSMTFAAVGLWESRTLKAQSLS